MSDSPVIYITAEDRNLPSDLEQKIRSENREDANILLDYPTVYIHYWPCSAGKYNVYVGESNDVVNRTSEHHRTGMNAMASGDSGVWQRGLVDGKHDAKLIIIGHKLFNKSMTLDVENRLIEYVTAMQDTVEKSLNGRGNPQNKYYPDEAFERVFNRIWSGLRRKQHDLFISETRIRDSAIFKASPLKKLTEEQIQAKDRIIQKVFQALQEDKEGQLIFVQGEAGTGKTVLTTSIFYDLVKRGDQIPLHRTLSCHLMVNHDQQHVVYEQMAVRLELGANVVHKPTTFINAQSPDDKVDVAFVDEGHLLLTRGKQSYQGRNQLEDIINRARVTVVMFDEYQILNTEEYWEPQILEQFKDLSKGQGNYIELSNQLRMECSLSTLEWLNDFSVNRKLNKFQLDGRYDVRSFDSPKDLHEEISRLARKEETKLSRVVATYDWPYSAGRKREDGRYWSVEIDGWSMPWNYELDRELDKATRKKNRSLAWAEQPQTVNEIGSTYSIQGFDLSYVGVILGPSVKYRNGEVVFDPSCSKNEKAMQQRTLSDKSKARFGEVFIRNEVKVLMSRGIKGLYLYACDGELRNALKKALRGAPLPNY